MFRIANNGKVGNARLVFSTLGLPGVRVPVLVRARHASHRSIGIIRNYRACFATERSCAAAALRPSAFNFSSKSVPLMPRALCGASEHSYTVKNCGRISSHSALSGPRPHLLAAQRIFDFAHRQVATDCACHE